MTLSVFFLLQLKDFIADIFKHMEIKGQLQQQLVI